ncbi:hypothetical protein F5X99DRAFT_394908 [Biscogniauxia marginata]|nr:hypothetical protein F5X99DRAFT_394908 [Biscogniauxia marginata]
MYVLCSCYIVLLAPCTAILDIVSRNPGKCYIPYFRAHFGNGSPEIFPSLGSYGKHDTKVPASLLGFGIIKCERKIS